MSTTTHSNQSSTQAGMVSIMVTLILMIVLSLIVLGFAQIARRNQRQALDRQLSTQAFYAAETAVNDVRNLIKTAGVGASIPTKPDCTNGSGAEALFYAGLPSNVLSAGANVSYTCVMVNPTPSTLNYSLDTTSGFVVPLTATSGNINTLTFTWTTADATNTTPSNGCPTGTAKVFSSTGAWTSSGCGYGVFRFDLVPTSGSFNMASLQSSTMSTFVVPLRTGGTNTTTFATNGSGDLAGVHCTNANCTLTITSGLGGSQYYLRVSTLYKPINLQISGTGSSGAVSFQGAQAVIDATGKAQDVLRRIQVSLGLPTAGKNQTSDYAIQSTDSICKRFVVMDNYFNSSAATAAPSMDDGGNPLCQ
ncbi:MAG TPA: pilus assembly PilX N-terminal domain-containing protein [Candidatus Saccharimonadales bacterium]|nr:pilus assembly PilX N-terminal domain-containing protein [Candidatus Saccharimonadales bacterium]